MKNIFIASLLLLMLSQNVFADSLRKEFEKHNFTSSDFRTAQLLSALNNSSAHAVLGTFYILGEFTEQDTEKGLRLIDKAVKGKNKYAIYGLAKIYEEGIHVKQDYQKSFHYYSLLEDQKEKEVYYELGKMYLKGLGTTQNISKGKDYLQKASEKGHAEARKILKNIK